MYSSSVTIMRNNYGKKYWQKGKPFCFKQQLPCHVLRKNATNPYFAGSDFTEYQPTPAELPRPPTEWILSLKRQQSQIQRNSSMQTSATEKIWRSPLESRNRDSATILVLSSRPRAATGESGASSVGGNFEDESREGKRDKQSYTSAMTKVCFNKSNQARIEELRKMLRIDTENDTVSSCQLWQ